MIVHSGQQDLASEYDYIVVGSGAGGGTVAANLARAGFQVLVLEAGGNEEPLDYQAPAFHALSTENNELAWKFYVQHYEDSERQKSDSVNYINGKVVDGAARHGIFYPRAGTLGGCTAHHAMIFIYPHNSDWDHIAALTGDPSWAADKMRSYFERLERCGYVRRRWLDPTTWFNRARHGFDGWLPTTTADPLLLTRDARLARFVLAAFKKCHGDHVNGADDFVRRIWARLESRFDPNDWRRINEGFEGATFTPLTIRNGFRYGTRERIVETMREFPDRLTIRLHALVTKVNLEGSKATGVEFLDGAHLYRADPNAPREQPPAAPRVVVGARREVILAGGTFNTPQILMLSGIGPANHLRAHGIEPRIELDHVGANLHDRYEVGIVHETDQNFDILRDASFTEPASGQAGDREYEDWRKHRKGLYATNGAVIAIIKRSDKERPDPDLYMFAVPGHFSGYRPCYSNRVREEKNQFTWVILKGHTNNTAGWVRLRTPHAWDTPDINFKYFEEGNDASGDDLRGLVEGVEYVRSIMADELAHGLTERIPGKVVKTTEQIASFVRSNAWGHHACGTCRIGQGDKDSVLDSRFNVRKANGLRVVDASVFPRIPGLFILSAVYMIAEKASDAIIADAAR